MFYDDKMIFFKDFHNYSLQLMNESHYLCNALIYGIRNLNTIKQLILRSHRACIESLIKAKKNTIIHSF